MTKLYTLLIISTMILATPVFSQEVAMDFNRTSCNGTEHHLFDDLDAGNVVIVEFVMLNCAPCIVATNALKTLCAPYETTHPGRVKIYTFAYLNLYNCDQIMAWANANGFSHEIFSMGEEQVTYYGGMGMPTIVILGKNEHKVYYKTVGYIPALDPQITAAIDVALTEGALGLEENKRDIEFKVYPTVFTDNLILDAGSIESGYSADLYNSAGHKVISTLINPNDKTSLSTSGLPAGMYLLRLSPSGALHTGVSKTYKLVKN